MADESTPRPTKQEYTYFQDPLFVAHDLEHLELLRTKLKMVDSFVWTVPDKMEVLVDGGHSTVFITPINKPYREITIHAKQIPQLQDRLVVTRDCLHFRVGDSDYQINYNPQKSQV